MSQVVINLCSDFYDWFIDKVPDGVLLQKILEQNIRNYGGYLSPAMLIKGIGTFIEAHDPGIDVLYNVHFDGIRKKEFLKKQVFYLGGL